VHNAVVAVRRDHFAGGGAEHVHIAARDAARLRPIRGNVAVRPTSASLVATDGRGRRPPEAIHQRSVVATRAPQDHSGRRSAAGLAPAPGARGPAPRLVNAPRVGRGQAHAAMDHAAPRGGGGTRSDLGRGMPHVLRGGRETPPPPPRAARPGLGGPEAHGSPVPPPPHVAPPSRARGERIQPGRPREGTSPRAARATPPPLPGAVRRGSPDVHTSPVPPRVGHERPEPGSPREGIPPPAPRREVRRPPRPEGTFPHPDPPRMGGRAAPPGEASPRRFSVPPQRAPRERDPGRPQWHAPERRILPGVPPPSARWEGSPRPSRFNGLPPANPRRGPSAQPRLSASPREHPGRRVQPGPDGR
jgi:hypothetical protein